ncbi:hypothetical protein NDU88_006799 [Pleurodeles waltl]|uniref:Basic proline-rich protein-like n=1 Tax=Pleurodeles waltl TaxID=8319 RepID=A0AAV7PSB0_PLEWA|nr:hypothetical protein NDU88_006799 [Pleurodeles waltl]
MQLARAFPGARLGPSQGSSAPFVPPTPRSDHPDRPQQDPAPPPPGPAAEVRRPARPAFATPLRREGGLGSPVRPGPVPGHLAACRAWLSVVSHGCPRSPPRAPTSAAGHPRGAVEGHPLASDPWGKKITKGCALAAAPPPSPAAQWTVVVVVPARTPRCFGIRLRPQIRPFVSVRGCPPASLCCRAGGEGRRTQARGRPPPPRAARHGSLPPPALRRRVQGRGASHDPSQVGGATRCPVREIPGPQERPGRQEAAPGRRLPEPAHARSRQGLACLLRWLGRPGPSGRWDGRPDGPPAGRPDGRPAGPPD